MLRVLIAALLAVGWFACGGADDGRSSLEERCLASAAPLLAAMGDDLLDWVEREVEKDTLGIEMIQFSADLQRLEAENFARAFHDKCTVDPQAAFDGVCDVEADSSGLNESLWQLQWCP